MQKLIPTIYFYVLSTVGMVLFIIGLFNSIHYIVGITAYEKYPLRYGGEESRCSSAPMPVMRDQRDIVVDIEAERGVKGDCLKGLEKERQSAKVDDLEKSIAFTAIGLLVFAIHFYFARKQKTS